MDTCVDVTLESSINESSIHMGVDILLYNGTCSINKLLIIMREPSSLIVVLTSFVAFIFSLDMSDTLFEYHHGVYNN